MNQQRVSADVAENDDVVGRHGLGRTRERRVGLVIGHEMNLVPRRQERRAEPVHPLGISAGRKAIEALHVDGVHHPRFASDEYFCH
jgi:hypothetical protein